MKQTIAYYNENAEEFCQTTQNADMRFCREKFLTVLRKSVNTTDFQTNGRFFNDYMADELAALITSCYFSIEEIFITQDVRQNREREPWLNVLARKSR